MTTFYHRRRRIFLTPEYIRLRRACFYTRVGVIASGFVFWGLAVWLFGG